MQISNIVNTYSKFYLAYICILDYFILCIYKLLLRTEDLLRWASDSYGSTDRIVKDIFHFF
jgi:hypothetical protein